MRVTSLGLERPFMRKLLRKLRPSAGPLLTMGVRGGQLRLLMLDRGSVVWHRVVPLNPAYLEGGVISQPRALAMAMQTTLSQSPHPGVTQAVAGVPGYHALSSIVDIPASREFRPEQVLPREARRLFAYRPDSSILAWWPIKGTGDGTRRYLMTVTRRSAVQSFREVFSMAGMELLALDSGPLAAARASNIEEGLVVQAEIDGGDVVVIKNGSVGLVRSAYWGEDISDEDSLLARMTDLVERSIASHNEANPMGPLNVHAPLVLLGAGADVLGDRLAQAAGRMPASVNAPLDVPEDLPMGELAANVGMALRAVH